MRFWKITLLSLALSLTVGCASQVGSTTQGGVVGVNRVQHLAGSSQQYNQQGEQQYRATHARGAAKGVLNRDPALLVARAQDCPALDCLLGYFAPMPKIGLGKSIPCKSKKPMLGVCRAEKSPSIAV